VKPLVSVITPSYNPGRRLARCLDAVRRQQYGAVEHIVVDGGSTDGTVDLLEGSGVRFVSEPDRGQSDAINKGFAMATGDVIGWINADDYLTPWASGDAAWALRSSPDSGWVYAPVAVVTGQRRHVIRPPRRLRPHHFLATNPVPQPGSFYTCAALERIGPLEESLHYGMDLDLWLRLLDAGYGGCRLPRIGAVFEVHSQSKSGGLPLHDFVVDQERAFRRNGWQRSADAFRGRALALQWGDVHAVDGALLEAAVAGENDIVRACAYAEAAILGLKAGDLSALRWLTAGVLRSPEALARLWVAVQSLGWKALAR
jgi:GT2 family glycosyltransferase